MCLLLDLLTLRPYDDVLHTLKTLGTIFDLRTVPCVMKPVISLFRFFIYLLM